jgi:hypothetical protein
MQDVTRENDAKRGEPSPSRPVKLRLVERSNQPAMVNLSTVAATQGIAYLDLGFVDPALLGAVARAAQAGQPAPNVVEGCRVARVAMPLESLVGLHQQIQQVLIRARKVGAE